MFGLFKKSEYEGPVDVKRVRDILLRFIKEEFLKAEGGEGRNIKALNLFVFCTATEKQIYEAAVYLGEKDRFKDEVQRIADDYAVDIPYDWEMIINFGKDVPVEARKIDNIDVAVFIRTNDYTIQRTGSGYIRILNGEAEKEEYFIDSNDGKINIGREKKTRVDDGYFRFNHIAFPADSTHESNKFVSRQHAHIEWDNDSGSFMLYADEGGIPPRNKIKIRSPKNENLIKLISINIGHRLVEGDQVILGDSAVIEYSNHSENNQNG